MTKAEIYKLIQDFLRDPPILIWGSGATCAYGLPSMNDLNNILKEKFDFFDKNNTNLEEELGKDKYEKHINEIRKSIWSCVEQKDVEILNKILIDFDRFKGIKQLIRVFTEPHPHVLNIITTNYDRVLEYVLETSDIAFTDGFSGRLLSLFSEDFFKKTSDYPFVNLIKVHGSLNWFEINGETRYFNTNEKYVPKIIPPGKNKYKQAFWEPYRNLIQISDSAIKKSKSLLVVGFGFNDEHLTPRITDQIRKNMPIVVITKKMTNTTEEKLKIATNYLVLEEYKENKTKITYKKVNDKTNHIEITEGSLWKLDNFMEVLS